MTDKKLYELCREYGRNARMWRRKFEALLPEVEKRGLYRKHGFHSIYEFAAKLGGVGHKSVEEILRVSRKVEDKPLLRAEIEKQGYAKVRAVTPLIETEKEEDLVHLVKALPISAIQETVKIRTCGTPNVWGSEPVNSVNRLSFEVDSETEFLFRKFKQELEKEKKEPVSFNETLKTLLMKAGNSEKGNSGAEPRQTWRTAYNNTHEIIRRAIPAFRKHALPKKCEFPGCRKPATIIHHPDRFALTKNHKNITSLCKIHHKIAHAGLIENEQESAKQWRICNTPDKNTKKFGIDQKVMRYQLL
ncbi:MAG: hypothetical protein ABH856_01705 [Patescibacteria group bacterium]